MSTKANIVIDAATTFSVTFNLTDQNNDPLNLTGYTATSAMRRWYTSTNAVNFNTSINTIAGSITLELDANTTSTLYPVRYIYDVFITDGISESRVVEGEIQVTPAVSITTILNSN